MGWHAHLTDDRGHEEGWWDYTHNTNGMANATLRDSGYDTAVLAGAEVGWWGRRGRSDVVAEYEAGILTGWTWWTYLDGKSGPEGAAFLDCIIRALEADSDRYRAMNPENGWGNYDDFIKLLIEMRNAVPEWPTTWTVNG